MTEAKNSTEGKPGPKRSKSPRGGRFSPIVEVNEPDPNWPTDPNEALGLWLDSLNEQADEAHKCPADEIEAFVAEVTRVAHEYLGAHGVADNEPAKVWAGKLLVAVGHWRGSIGGHCAAAMLAYGEVVKAAVLMSVYSEDRRAPLKASAAGTKGKSAKAGAAMDDLRERMAKLPRIRLKDAPTVRLALEAAGWKTPWTERVTEDRIRKVLSDLR